VSFSEGYQLVQRIGSGLAGALYLAESGTGPVVIRQFESRAKANSELWNHDRQAFLDAGRQTLGLTHPHIVQVLEVIDEGGEAFVASEYVTAETLERAMLSRRFTSEETGTLLRDVAAALDFAHSRGVVHGDLKPSNIFLPNKRAKIADFAISPRARLDSSRPTPSDLIHRYLSPEHLRSPQSIDARSDQYSLAVIAYELYADESPYGSPSNLPAAILTEEIPPPSRVNSQLSPRLDQPFMRALDRDPARRFASCTEFVTILGAGGMTQVGGRGRRRRSIFLGALAAALVAALGIGYYHSSKPASTHTSPPVMQLPVTESPKKPVQQAAAKNSSPVVEPSSTPSAKKASMTPAKPKGRVPDATASVREVPQVSPPPPLERAYQLAVYSRDRNHPIQEDTSFRYDDPTLGELADGDIKAFVTVDGQPLPTNGELTLEWVVDGVPTDKGKVTLGQMSVYGNEPTPGTYVVTLYYEERAGKKTAKKSLKAVKTFTFRITR
jgi:serine/threonine protein kinase